jgi:hypothetical protein
MFDPADMAERHARILAELAELGMGLARQAAQDAEAAESPEERARAALVFQRMSRSIRQSLALEARLARDLARDAREEEARRAEARRERVNARRRDIREGVAALVWREMEELDEDEAEAFEDRIDDAVHEEVVAEGFFTDPLADQVARCVARLGYEITPEGALRRLAPASAPPPEPAWRASG